jgi:AcrR family transcriptional regulator
MREKHTDLRIVKTREALCKALLKLLTKRAFQDIKISELCDEAGVSRATFYNNFNNMDEVFSFYLQNMWEPIIAQVKKEAVEKNLTLDQAYKLFIELSVTKFEPLHEIFVSIVKVNPSSQVFDCLNTYLNQAISEVMSDYKDYSFDVPQELLVSYIAGGFTGLLLRLYPISNRFDHEKKVQILYHLTFEIYFLYNVHKKANA